MRLALGSILDQNSGISNHYLILNAEHLTTPFVTSTCKMTPRLTDSYDSMEHVTDSKIAPYIPIFVPNLTHSDIRAQYSFKMSSVQRYLISVVLILTAVLLFFAQTGEAAKGPKITNKVALFMTMRMPDDADDCRFTSTSLTAMSPWEEL